MNVEIANSKANHTYYLCYTCIWFETEQNRTDHRVAGKKCVGKAKKRKPKDERRKTRRTKIEKKKIFV